MKTGDRFKSRQLHIEDYLKVIPAEQGRNSGVLDYRKIEGRDDIFTDFWTKNLLELVIRRDNLNKAYLQVKRNKARVELTAWTSASSCLISVNTRTSSFSRSGMVLQTQPSPQG